MFLLTFKFARERRIWVDICLSLGEPSCGGAAPVVAKSGGFGASLSLGCSGLALGRCGGSWDCQVMDTF